MPDSLSIYLTHDILSSEMSKAINIQSETKMVNYNKNNE